MSDDVETYRGRQLVIFFEGARCIHSRACVLGRPDVFRPNVDGPWIEPDAAPPEEVAAIARACPSGAIRVERLDGGPAERPPLVNTVHVRENGPLAFRADLEIEGHGVHVRATLCRCGRSKRKPFCDGSHTEVGFSATGEPPSRESQPLAARDGRLRVELAKDGPLLLQGNVELCAGTGRTLDRTTKCALCRCGGSANKPYCDGTHRRIGFQG